MRTFQRFTLIGVARDTHLRDNGEFEFMVDVDEWGPFQCLIGSGRVADLAAKRLEDGHGVFVEGKINGSCVVVTSVIFLGKPPQ
jgi:hypothetical protein